MKIVLFALSDNEKTVCNTKSGRDDGFKIVIGDGIRQLIDLDGTGARDHCHHADIWASCRLAWQVDCHLRLRSKLHSAESAGVERGLSRLVALDQSVLA